MISLETKNFLTKILKSRFHENNHKLKMFSFLVQTVVLQLLTFEQGCLASENEETISFLFQIFLLLGDRKLVSGITF